MTSAQLAEELEVSQRTILRDLDAMTEAGLPIIAHQGNRGGIELGFNYRTRLTGLAADEAEALAVLLFRPSPEIEALGLRQAARRAQGKLVESFPDTVRERIVLARDQFTADSEDGPPPDPRVAALADAIRRTRSVTLRCRSASPQRISPVRLFYEQDTWWVVDAATPDAPVPLEDWADINISTQPV